jgi:hypothetical protein
MSKSNFALRLQPSLMDEVRKVAETEGVARADIPRARRYSQGARHTFPRGQGQDPGQG